MLRLIFEVIKGSSPLARGLRAADHNGDRDRGIIPARAGFTAATNEAGGGVQDHPRSRGVYRGAAHSMQYRKGSSPLARGLPISPTQIHARHRIIPARAGFTPGRSCPWSPSPDHPRSRGVYLSMITGVASAGGSSPLARGLPPARQTRPTGWRIIPARAGFTWTSRTSSRRRGDHPRSRGVYIFGPDSDPVYDGSSPLARGLPGGSCRGL